MYMHRQTQAELRGVYTKRTNVHWALYQAVMQNLHSANVVVLTFQK